MVVYKLLNKITGKYYIGSTIHFEVRKLEHYGMLRNNKHHNKFLQEDFNIYKENSFDMYILHDGFLNIEQMLLKEYELIVKTFKENYNINKDVPLGLILPKKKNKLKKYDIARIVKAKKIRKLFSKKSFAEVQAEKPQRVKQRVPK